MKSYIGVKIVQAEPEVKNGIAGYKVVYSNPDGTDYTSWSPAGVFEDAYYPLENPTKISQADVEGFVLPCDSSQIDEKTTQVKIETITGFTQYETFACVDPENYDHNIGVSCASERIMSRLWPFMGFVLQWGRFGLKKAKR